MLEAHDGSPHTIDRDLMVELLVFFIVHVMLHKELFVLFDQFLACLLLLLSLCGGQAQQDLPHCGSEDGRNTSFRNFSEFFQINFFLGDDVKHYVGHFVVSLIEIRFFNFFHLPFLVFNLFSDFLVLITVEFVSYLLKDVLSICLCNFNKILCKTLGLFFK